VLAHELQQVQRAGGVDAEIRERLARRPVVRGLRGGVDHQRDRAAVVAEDLGQLAEIAHVGVVVLVVRVQARKPLAVPGGRGLGAEVAAHVVVMPTSMPSSAKNATARADQARRAV
jgi:hypothetical protein